MPHNSVFGILSSTSPMSISARGSTASSSPPAKRFRDLSSTMSSTDRPEFPRPPSSTRTAQMPSPIPPLLRRRPAAPRQTSSTENPLNLKLPEVTLGRYHPLNFSSSSSSSQHSSMAGTPSPGLNSPQIPISPRTHSRQLSEAERRLHEYYRDRAFASGRGGVSSGGLLSPSDRPTVPRLEAAVSPGPVTPLELEAAASYFGVAGSGRGVVSPAIKKSTDARLGCQGVVRQGLGGRTSPIGSF